MWTLRPGGLFSAGWRKGMVLVLWVLTLADVTSASAEPVVSCVLSETCLLPCAFEAGADPVIYWMKKPDDIRVYTYVWAHHQTRGQHKNYTNRTSLSDGVRSGNASLLLHPVRVSDEGRYRCLASTASPHKITESYVNVKVHAPVLQMSLQLQNQELVCRAEKIFPRPVLKWNSSEPQDQPQTTFTPTESGLFSVRSSVNLTERLPLEYSCNISTELSWRSATYRRSPQMSASGSVMVPCTEPSAPVKTLTWSFNHREVIVTKTGPETVFNKSWRQFVDGLSHNNSLLLKDLSRDQLGLFTCELSTDTEQFFIHTEVTGVIADSGRSRLYLLCTLLILAVTAVVVAVIYFCRRKIYQVIQDILVDVCHCSYRLVPQNSSPEHNGLQNGVKK